MKKSRPAKRRDGSRKKARPSKTASMILLAAIAAVVFAAVSIIGADPSNGVEASANPAMIPPTQKRFKATRPFVLDKQSKQLRMPTQQEIDETVENLATLAKRSEDLPQVAAQSGAVAVNLDGGFGGVMLARPNSDGTWETKCVFTFEEGAEFLGLVEDN